MSFSLLTLNAQKKNMIYWAGGGGMGKHYNQAIASNAFSGLIGSTVLGYERQKTNIFRFNIDGAVHLLQGQSVVNAMNTTIIDPTVSFLWMKGNMV